VALNDYQQALEAQVNAAAEAAAAVARYNATLARIEEAQGTLLESRQILFAQDPPPEALPGAPPGMSTAPFDGPKTPAAATPPALQDSYRATGHAVRRLP
jgi:hypothetical protein